MLPTSNAPDMGMHEPQSNISDVYTCLNAAVLPAWLCDETVELTPKSRAQTGRKAGQLAVNCHGH